MPWGDGTITARLASVLESSIRTYATSVETNPETGNYTLVLTDASLTLEIDSVSGVSVTVPPNSSVAFATGTMIEVFQYGAGQVTFVPGSGVTIRSSGAKLKLTGQYSTAVLWKRATNEWVLIGDITT
jgi:hypothetical protein